MCMTRKVRIWPFPLLLPSSCWSRLACRWTFNQNFTGAFQILHFINIQYSPVGQTYLREEYVNTLLPKNLTCWHFLTWCIWPPGQFSLCQLCLVQRREPPASDAGLPSHDDGDDYTMAMATAWKDDHDNDNVNSNFRFVNVVWPARDGEEQQLGGSALKELRVELFGRPWRSWLCLADLCVGILRLTMVIIKNK